MFERFRRNGSSKGSVSKSMNGMSYDQIMKASTDLQFKIKKIDLELARIEDRKRHIVKRGKSADSSGLRESLAEEYVRVENEGEYCLQIRRRLARKQRSLDKFAHQFKMYEVVNSGDSTDLFSHVDMSELQRFMNDSLSSMDFESQKLDEIDTIMSDADTLARSPDEDRRVKEALRLFDISQDDEIERLFEQIEGERDHDLPAQHWSDMDFPDEDNND
ncbi:MAG: hypothetical protein KDD42_00915 [Bdellovibrionales bacterium]|nr:hypothetical protein [Bdellovibrionales bacterium]